MAGFVPFTVGQSATANVVNAAFNVRQEVYQAGFQTVNNTTTLAASVYLTLPVLGSSVYTVNMCVFYDSATAADFKASFQISGGGSWFMTPFGLDVSVASSTGSIQTAPVNTTTWAYGGIGVGSNLAAQPAGYIVTSGAGTVTFQFAQNTANASVTTLQAGSFMRLTKVA